MNLSSMVRVVTRGLRAKKSIAFGPGKADVLPVLQSNSSAIILSGPGNELRLFSLPLCEQGSNSCMLRHIIGFKDSNDCAVYNSGRFTIRGNVASSSMVKIMATFCEGNGPCAISSVGCETCLRIVFCSGPLEGIVTSAISEDGGTFSGLGAGGKGG